MPNNFITEQEAKTYNVFLKITPEQFDELVKTIVPEPRKWSDMDKLMVFADINWHNGGYDDNYAVECPVCKKPYLAFWKEPFRFTRTIWCYSCQTGIGSS